MVAIGTLIGAYNLITIIMLIAASIFYGYIYYKTNKYVFLIALIVNYLSLMLTPLVILLGIPLYPATIHSGALAVNILWIIVIMGKYLYNIWFITILGIDKFYKLAALKTIMVSIQTIVILYSIDLIIDTQAFTIPITMLIIWYWYKQHGIHACADPFDPNCMDNNDSKWL